MPFIFSGYDLSAHGFHKLLLQLNVIIFRGCLSCHGRDGSGILEDGATVWIQVGSLGQLVKGEELVSFTLTGGSAPQVAGRVCIRKEARQ